MLFLQSLKIWPTYRNGWTIRVREVRQFSLQLANATAPVAAQPPTSIPASTMGKGKPPEPTVAKNVAKGAGAGAAAGAGGLVQWLQVHPALCAVIVGSVILTAILVIGEINRWHRQRSEEPHPDTPVVPELANLVEEFS
jgi:lysozyme family protein